MPKPRTFWTQCWLDFSYCCSQVQSHAAFSRQLMGADDDEPPRTVRDWRAGRHSADRQSVVDVDQKLSICTVWLYLLPMVSLLTLRKWSVPDVLELLAPYIVHNAYGELRWQFPNDEVLRENGRLPYPCAFDDTTHLVERGDICGFMAILGLIRLAEAQRDGDRHSAYSRDLYRAIPAIAREPWLQPRVDVLLDLIERVLHRVPLSTITFRVRWDVVRGQIWASDCPSGSPRNRSDAAVGCTNIQEDLIAEQPLMGKFPVYKRPIPLLTGRLECEQGARPRKRLNFDWLTPELLASPGAL